MLLEDPDGAPYGPKVQELSERLAALSDHDDELEITGQMLVEALEEVANRHREPLERVEELAFVLGRSVIPHVRDVAQLIAMTVSGAHRCVHEPWGLCFERGAAGHLP